MSSNPQAQKVLTFARVTGELLKRHQEKVAEDARVKAAVAEAIPGAVKAMLENDRIYDHQQEAVAEKLASNPVAAIEMLGKVAKHRNAAELAQIGNEVQAETKQAAARRITGAPVADFDEDEAGRAYRERLLGGRD